MTVVCPRRTRRARALPAVVCSLSGALVACGTSHPLPPGTPVVTMGNLNNSPDFFSYIITIDAIELFQADGTGVTPFITPTSVDLAQLNSRTELVEAPAVPEGTYTHAVIQLDWSATTAVTLNQNGVPVSATPQDINGNSMAAASVTVTFDPSHPLVITQQQSVRLQVEFDLTASNQLTASTTVQVQPFAVMTPAPVDSTPLHLRGVYVTNQDVSSGFYMNSRPFYDLSSELGAVIVHTNAQTYFNINGVLYVGAAGLAELPQQQAYQPIAVYGTLGDLSAITPTFNATQVYFGSAAESQLAYYFTGTVGSRSADTFTLRAADYLSPSGLFGYFDSVPVTVASGTPVFLDGVAATGLSIADVSVGQQLLVAGQPIVDSTNNLTGIDATTGFIRLQPTTLWGILNANGTQDLLSLGRFAPAQLNFAGTGSSGHTATPTAYVVDTSAVPPGGPAVMPDELLQVQGRVAPFGGAPPDFTATALTPGTASLQTLVVDWVNGGSAAPFSSNGSGGLVVNLADANLGSIHEIRTGPASLDLKSLPASPLITTTGADQSNLQLAIGSTTLAAGVSVFNSAAAFADAIHADFSGTNKIFRLVAYGQYDSASNTFVAARIHIALHE
ncbi:MAG TPA: DUF4382 domain-containing protein [Steroidobacteraceae bacterium]|nr:DUF4382 domain-containing protein [Steroidobacteraceae bacterium]